jgi:hypothetical protein
MSMRVRVLALLPLLLATLAGMSASAVSNHAAGATPAANLANEAGRTWASTPL